MSESGQICRLCLRGDLKMFDLNKYGLKEQFFEITGIKETNQECAYPQSACYVCAYVLRKAYRFSRSCQLSDHFLSSLLVNGEPVNSAGSCKTPSDDIHRLKISEPVCHKYLPEYWNALENDANCIKVEDSDFTKSGPYNNASITDEQNAIACSAEASGCESDREEMLVTSFDYKTEVKEEPKEDKKSEKKRKKEKKCGSGTVKKKKRKTKQHQEITDLEIKEELDSALKCEDYDQLEDVISDDDRTLAEMAKPKVVKKRGPAEKVSSYAEEIMLTREEQLAELEKRRESENFKTSPYQCQLCFIGYSHLRTFNNHMAKHDPSAGDFACEICHIRKKHKYSLTHHYNLLHAKRYKCRSCTYVARTSTQARLHQRWHNGFMFQCQFCGRTFSHQTSFLSHVRMVHPSEFVCDLCGERFVNQSGVNKHKRAIHGRANDETEPQVATGPYCAECDLQFSSEEAFRRHTVTSSRHNLGNSCKICGEVYMIASELQTHERLCTVLNGRRQAGDGTAKEADRPERVTCKECGASLSSMNAYRAHHRLKHLGIRQYIPCTDCNLRFPSKARLRYHRRTHTGERPYSCPHCMKRFAMPDLLKLHARTHTGERPYACTLCAKAFASKAGLNRHNMVHTGLKPYECEVCGKKFSQCKALKHHIHTVHMKLPPPYSKRRRGREAVTTTQEANTTGDIVV